VRGWLLGTVPGLPCNSKGCQHRLVPHKNRFPSARCGELRSEAPAKASTSPFPGAEPSPILEEAKGVAEGTGRVCSVARTPQLSPVPTPAPLGSPRQAQAGGTAAGLAACGCRSALQPRVPFLVPAGLLLCKRSRPRCPDAAGLHGLIRPVRSLAFHSAQGRV